MSGGRGTSEHTCTCCSRTFTLTQQPDWGVAFVCQRCKQATAKDLAAAFGNASWIDYERMAAEFYEARGEDQDQQ